MTLAERGAAGNNLRLVLTALALWLAFILAAIAKANTSVRLLPALPSMT
jgi:hypothetical protein